jgi:hypothetical protein
MEKMIAVCGIECHQCPAFLATRENDDLKRKEVAEMWSKDFKAEIKPEDINCEGCTSGKERLFSHCQVRWSPKTGQCAKL